MLDTDFVVFQRNATDDAVLKAQHAADVSSLIGEVQRCQPVAITSGLQPGSVDAPALALFASRAADGSQPKQPADVRSLVSEVQRCWAYLSASGVPYNSAGDPITQDGDTGIGAP